MPYTEYDSYLEVPPMLVLVNTVPRFLTGGPGACPPLDLKMVHWAWSSVLFWLLLSDSKYDGNTAARGSNSRKE